MSAFRHATARSCSRTSGKYVLRVARSAGCPCPKSGDVSGIPLLTLRVIQSSWNCPKGFSADVSYAHKTKTPAVAGVLVTARAGLNRPRLGRYGTCASRRRLRSSPWGARSFARRGRRVPGAAS